MSNSSLCDINIFHHNCRYSATAISLATVIGARFYIPPPTILISLSFPSPFAQTKGHYKITALYRTSRMSVLQSPARRLDRDVVHMGVMLGSCAELAKIPLKINLEIREYGR